MKLKKSPLRFAFYGRSEAGKTSILAALNSPRHPSENGYSAKVLPLPFSGPNVEPDVWNEKDTNGQLIRGHENIEMAAQQLKAEGRLDATKLTDGLTRIRCEFLSKKTKREIELVDYAGETIISGELSDAGSLVNKLHESLKNRNAFLIVVEAPLGENTNAAITENLKSLSDTFSALRGQKGEGSKLQIPVVLLINKWDRIQQSSGTPLEESIEEFFEKFPPFKSARDDLRNGTREGLFRVFPISAIGPVEHDGTNQAKCKFVDGALKSQGLEAPFIWAAEKCDELSRDKRKAKLKWAAALLGLVAACWAVVDYFNSSNAYRQAEQQANDPQGQHEPYEDWLKSYSDSGWHQNWLMALSGYSRNDAAEELNQFQKRREGEYWKLVSEAKNEDEKARLAISYVGLFPNGVHYSDCKEIEARNILENDRKIFGDFNERVKTQLPTAEINELEQLLSQLGDLKIDNRDGLLVEIEACKGSINQAIQGRLRDADIARWKKHYQANLDGSDLAEAANLLGSKIKSYGKSSWFQKIVSEYVEKFPSRFEKITTDLKLKGKWKAANLEIDKIENRYGVWPDDLKSESILQSLRKVRKSFERDYDKYLYGRCRDSPTEKMAENYLESAPLGTMANQVNELKQWLEVSDPERSFQLKIDSIDWADNAQSDGHNFIKVYVDKDTVVELEGQDSQASEKTFPDQPFDRQIFHSKLNDRVTLKIEIIEEDWLLWGGGDDPHGSGEETFYIQDLLRGNQKVSLDYSGEKHTATISISDTDPCPKLPRWSDR